MVDNSSYRVKPEMLTFLDEKMGHFHSQFNQMRSINDLDSKNYIPGLSDVMVAVLGVTKLFSSDDNNSDSYQNRNKKPPYERMLLFYCLNGNAGSNCFVVFLGQHQNANFYGSSHKFRDSHNFSELFVNCSLPAFFICVTHYILFNCSFFSFFFPISSAWDSGSL